MALPTYYASECYGNFGVFHRCGTQIGGWWPTMKLAEQAAELLNQTAQKG
jgi:hypothetical protein